MRQIDHKYHTQGQIYKYDGTMIPSDEPLILFRSRDRLVPKMLEYYKQLRLELPHSESSMELLQSDIDAIKDWQAAHPELQRNPGMRD